LEGYFSKTKMKLISLYTKFYYLIYGIVFILSACNANKIKQTNVGYGWSNNKVNTVKFRKNALTSYKQYQFTAYYDADGYLVVGKRKTNSNHWQTVKTPYRGNSKDAHNAISIAVDGDGYLHVSWDHHNSRLRYAKGISPLSLTLGKEEPMTGIEELKVTYPEFYNFPNGNLLFFYRSGFSGRGNIVINSYDVNSKKWSQLCKNLLDGEHQRNAYWQSCIDDKYIIHLSWVWRESGDVSTNHDLCYARSKDGGITWEKSTGEKYVLPITAATSEYAWRIPQKSSLINQTAMTADKNGNPYIVTYWSENEIPQYQIVYLNDGFWKKENTSFRSIPFYLGGGGTKKIPISRPDILIYDKGKQLLLYILFTDEERGNFVSLAYRNLNIKSNWKITNLTTTSVGQWEPNYDLALWKKNHKLHIFTQDVTQVDGEDIANIKPTMIHITELNSKLPK
jgi:BNR repeat-containing family member